MTPALLPLLTIVQNGTFRHRLTWKTGSPAAPVDLTGCSARAQIRPEYNSDILLMAELNTDNGGIALGGADGTIDFYISDEDTRAIVVDTYRRGPVVVPPQYPAWDRGVIDLVVIHPNGEQTSLARGPVRALPGGPRP
jgi:hypothetical protein